MKLTNIKLTKNEISFEIRDNDNRQILDLNGDPLKGSIDWLECIPHSSGGTPSFYIQPMMRNEARKILKKDKINRENLKRRRRLYDKVKIDFEKIKGVKL